MTIKQVVIHLSKLLKLIFRKSNYVTVFLKTLNVPYRNTRLQFYQNRTEQNRNFIQLKLRPRTGGVRAHNTNRQIATKNYLQEIHNKNCLQELRIKPSGCKLPLLIVPCIGHSQSHLCHWFWMEKKCWFNRLWLLFVLRFIFRTLSMNG